MNDRLAKLYFLAPPANTPWKGPGRDWVHPVIERADGGKIDVGLPLFWHDPRWYRLAADRSDSLAVAVGAIGVLVSALRSDLRSPDGTSSFHDDKLSGGEDDDILIGGSTSYDSSISALLGIRAEWSRGDLDYASRIQNLRSGVGLNGRNRKVGDFVIVNGAGHFDSVDK